MATLNECLASAELHLGFHKPRARAIQRGIAARREAMRVRACCRPVRGGEFGRNPPSQTAAFPFHTHLQFRIWV